MLRSTSGSEQLARAVVLLEAGMLRLFADGSLALHRLSLPAAGVPGAG